MKASDKQVGGTHYSKLKIQPAEYCFANNLGGLELAIIKYATRWRDKGGFQDLDKIIHCVELLKELETKYGQSGSSTKTTEPHSQGPGITEVPPAYSRA